jgi:copper homeostasis protein
MPLPLIEICAYSIEAALAAQAAGADRIELCADASVGGITPSAGIIQTARELLHIPVFVMIRPRGGNFIYTETELASMKNDIAFCREHRIDGVVLGILDEQNNVDRETTAALVAAARPMEVTFHRAFDLTPDPIQALEGIIAAGCTRILTSGHRPTAIEGATDIAKLITAADGRITIMPGSGIRSTKLADLARTTGATEFHSSARALAVTVSTNTSNAIAESFGHPQLIDPAEVQQLCQVADSIG